MTRLLTFNLFFSLLWPTLNGKYSLVTLFTGFLLGLVVLAVINRNYGRFMLGLVTFIIYILQAILQSNIRLAWQVIRAIYDPKSEMQPGIVAVPLDVQHPIDRILLASIITLTPGTISIDLGKTAEGDVLYVHAFEVRDVEKLRKEIKNDFESRILLLRSYAESMDDFDPKTAAARRGE